MTIRKNRFQTQRTFYVLAFALIVLAALAAVPAFAQQGSWTTKGFAVEGTWKLVPEGGGWALELSDDFSTKKAPDLKLFLSPKRAGELSNRNATEGAVLISLLKNHRGAQRYKLPGNADPARAMTLVLHCEQYSKLWAVAPLR